jgi:hypothetical protein
VASGQQVLDIARSQLGIAENPPNSNNVLYADWAGLTGTPDQKAWCAAFVCWVLTQAGALDVARFVGCPRGVDLYKAAGRFGSEPRIASVVFFQWPGMGRACHVGFVEVVRSDGEVTIEGNTDEAGGGSGGKVMRHVRRANIVGFGYPQYDELAPQIPISVASHPMLKIGARGDMVRLLQSKLGFTQKNVDGIFGPQTSAAVHQFQGSHQLVSDGIVGPRTWAALG